MRVKSQKGSITVFVLIALLFYMGFLLLLYAGNINKVQTISEKLDLIKAIYNKNLQNIDDVYNRRLAQNDNMEPIIEDIPTRILVNHIESVIDKGTTLKDSYEKYGALEGKTEYIAFNNNFSSLKEVVQYANTNNLYGNCDIEINAYGNNGKKSTKQQTVEILKGAEIKSEADLKTALSVIEPLYLRLENNISCLDTILIDNVTHQLDLNNKEMSYTKENESFNFLTIGTNANITILDSSTDKNGTIIANLLQEVQSDGNARNNSICCIRNDGNLTIESGKVAANLVQKMLNKRDGTSVDDTCSTIENTGTINLKGGTIYSNIETQGCVYLVVKSSKSHGRGIINTGTINLEKGNIITNSVSNMIRASGATVLGKTYAYAYGILGSGTVNNSGNVVFTTTATSNSDGTYYTDSENIDISENSKVVIDEEEE